VASAERRFWPIQSIASAGMPNVDSFCVNTDFKPRQTISAQLELVFRASPAREANVRVAFLHSASAIEYETRPCAHDEQCEDGERKAIIKLVENGVSGSLHFSPLDVTSLMSGKLAGAVESELGLRSATLYMESLEFSPVEGYTAVCTTPRITAPTTIASVTSSGTKPHPTTGPGREQANDEDSRRAQFKADWMARHHATEEQWEKFQQNMQERSGVEISGHHSNKHGNKDQKHKDHKDQKHEDNNKDQKHEDNKDQRHDGKKEHAHEHGHRNQMSDEDGSMTLATVLPIAGGSSLLIFLLFLVGVCLCNNRRCKKSCKACATTGKKLLDEGDAPQTHEPVQYVSGDGVELGEMLGDAQV